MTTSQLQYLNGRAKYLYREVIKWIQFLVLCYGKNWVTVLVLNLSLKLHIDLVIPLGKSNISHPRESLDHCLPLRDQNQVVPNKKAPPISHQVKELKTKMLSRRVTNMKTEDIMVPIGSLMMEANMRTIQCPYIIGFNLSDGYFPYVARPQREWDQYQESRTSNRGSWNDRPYRVLPPPFLPPIW